MDEYEERIEQRDFENDVDDYEVVPNFEEKNMKYHDEGDADDDIGGKGNLFSQLIRGGLV